MNRPLITRRFVVGSTAAIAAGAATSVPFPSTATLLVAGSGGAAETWAEWLIPGLSRALPTGTPVRKELVGGADGVTAANQFGALTVPDGGTALLLPGAAATAWLVGDPRARFDPAQWVPTMAGITPGLVITRTPAARAGTKLRVAASSPTGPELPAMLGFDLLGIDWSPVFGIAQANAADALAQGQVDAICLTGRRVVETAQQLGSAGAQPLFSFGSVDDSGGRQRVPAFPEIPALPELQAARGGEDALRRAWFAAAAASDLDVALVLPHLTPASIVALWRRAAALATSGAQAQAGAQGVRAQPCPAATASTAAVLADAAGQLALRGWLANRLDYRPG